MKRKPRTRIGERHRTFRRLGITHRQMDNAAKRMVQDFCDRFLENISRAIEKAGTPKLGPNEYRCAECDGVFERGWSDEDAAAEAVQLFGRHADDDAVVCDVCFNRIMGKVKAGQN